MNMEENTLFPGRPNYVGPIHGVFAMLHHSILFEGSHNVLERIEYIKNNKPSNEVNIRLHNIMYLGNCDAKGLDAYYKAQDAYYKARDACDKAQDACDKAQDACDKQQILNYIRKYIPDCAWNKKTNQLDFSKGKK